MAVIELNGNYYTLAADENGVASVRQSYVQRLSAAYRTVGVQSRQDDTSVNRYVHAAFPLGLGWARIKRDSGRGAGGLLDSTCWTAFGPVTNGRLHETQTHADPAEHFRKAVNFKGDLWGLFEEDYSSGEGTNVVVRKYGSSSDDWTGGGTVLTPTTGNTAGARGFDMVAHKSNLFVICNAPDDEDSYEIMSSADGASWSVASGTGFPVATDGNAEYLTSTVTRRNNFDDDAGRFCSFGERLLLALDQMADSPDGAGNIQVWSTTDSGSNWGTEVSIPSGSGPKAFVDWFSLSGTRAPVLVTAEGIYSISAADNTFDLIYALDGNPNNGRWSAVGNDGALYVGLGDGPLIRLAITDSNVLEVMTVGPPGDGLVTSRQGHVNYILRTPSEWLLVAYGGHASAKDASIFMIDTSVILTDPETGKRFMPWHSLYEHGTANLDITTMAYSTEDDGTPRLHFGVEGASTSVCLHIEEPLAHPEQSSTIKYADQSILQLPDDDLGDPQTSAMVLQAFVDADDLTAGSGGSGGSGDEYIELRYGLNGASNTTTSLGDFLSGTLSLPFGSGAGVAARRIGINLMFDVSSTTTNTAKMHEFELQAQHVLLDKKAWEFVIDVAATARDYPPTVTTGEMAEEEIISNIETVVGSTTLLTFTAGRMAQTKVRIPNDAPPQFNLTVADSSGKDTGYRTGYISVRVEEGI